LKGHGFYISRFSVVIKMGRWRYVYVARDINTNPLFWLQVFALVQNTCSIVISKILWFHAIEFFRSLTKRKLKKTNVGIEGAWPYSYLHHDLSAAAHALPSSICEKHFVARVVGRLGM
jgi:hypothetical protein